MLGWGFISFVPTLVSLWTRISRIVWCMGSNWFWNSCFFQINRLLPSVKVAILSSLLVLGYSVHNHWFLQTSGFLMNQICQWVILVLTCPEVGTHNFSALPCFFFPTRFQPIAFQLRWTIRFWESIKTFYTLILMPDRPKVATMLYALRYLATQLCEKFDLRSHIFSLSMGRQLLNILSQLLENNVEKHNKLNKTHLTSKKQKKIEIL